MQAFGERDGESYKMTLLPNPRFQNWFLKNEFYAVLSKFPSGAKDFAAFKIASGENLLCTTRVKLVNDDLEGEVKNQGCEYKKSFALNP